MVRCGGLLTSLKQRSDFGRNPRGPSAGAALRQRAGATNGPGGTTVTTSPFTASATGITASTAYKVHFTQDDLASNHSSVASSASFTTASSGLDAATTAWINQVVTNGGSTPSSTSQGFVDTLIKAIKSNIGPNVNSVLDRMWLLANADNDEAQAFTSIINPSTATFATKSGSFTSTTSGYQGNGTTGLIDTHFTPSTDGTNFTANAMAIGAYSTSSRTTSQVWPMMGTDAASNNNGCGIFNYLDQSGTHGLTYMNNDNGVSLTGPASITNAKGFFIAQRTSSSAGSCRKYESATALTASSSTTATSGLSNKSFYICARNHNGSADVFSNDKITLAFCGGVLTSGQADQLAADVNAYMTSLGIAVY